MVNMPSQFYGHANFYEPVHGDLLRHGPALEVVVQEDEDTFKQEPAPGLASHYLAAGQVPCGI